MKFKNIFLFFLILVNLEANSQAVNSKAFDIMLCTLLSKTTPLVDIYAIEGLTDYQVLDAREKNEFDVSHLNNAIWVGYDDFNLSRVSNLNKQKPVLIYCSVGYRSEKIAEKLLAEGFEDVYNLYGGIFEWANAGKPVYRNKQEVDSVHAYDKVWGVWLNIDEKVYE